MRNLIKENLNNLVDLSLRVCVMDTGLHQMRETLQS